MGQISKNPQFLSDWLEIWRPFTHEIPELNHRLILRSTWTKMSTQAEFLKSSIFIRLIWKLKSICISDHQIQPPINFEVNIDQKVNIDQNVNMSHSSKIVSKIVNFYPIDLKFEHDFTSAHWIQPRIIFEVSTCQKVNIGQMVNNLRSLSKILNLQMIDLKFWLVGYLGIKWSTEKKNDDIIGHVILQPYCFFVFFNL